MYTLNKRWWIWGMSALVENVDNAFPKPDILARLKFCPVLRLCLCLVSGLEGGFASHSEHAELLKKFRSCFGSAQSCLLAVLVLFSPQIALLLLGPAKKGKREASPRERFPAARGVKGSPPSFPESPELMRPLPPLQAAAFPPTAVLPILQALAWCVLV